MESLQTLLPAFGNPANRRRVMTLVGIAALIAAIAVSWLWGTAPEYRVLYGNLEDKDGGAVIAALGQMNVPYKFSDGGGAILVPADKVHDARLRLASQGLPRGSTAGYELIGNQKLGTTQFQEQVNYQRALEGELARSIQALGAVRGARVHLAIPKPSMFTRDAQKPTASVLLGLHPGRALERNQIAAIVHLVSASVPQLSARDISVIDDSGNLLSAPNGEEYGLDASQLAYVREIENTYNRRIVEILEPIVGRGNVRARVTAELDFSRVESTAETYKPNQGTPEAAVRSLQSSDTANGAPGQASGVPGSASNQPGAQNAPGGSAQSNARRDSSTQFEVDRQVQHVRAPVGSVKRLSAAIAVNYRKTVASGKATMTALKPEELAQVNALAREAMGYSQQRGDTLNVAHAAFSVEEPAAVPDTPIWQDAGLIAMAKEAGRGLLVAALALYLVFGVLRPFFRQMAAREAASATAAAALPGPESVQQSAGERLESLRRLARDDPRAVANVVRNWTGKE